MLFKNLSQDAKRRLAIIAGVILLIIGLLLINVHHIENWAIRAYQPRIDRQAVNQAKHRQGSFDYKDTKSLSAMDIVKARRHAKDLPVVGAMAVPQANVYLPIAKGVSNNVLALAAGTMEPNQKMGQGNYALAGHNMSNLDPNVLFSPLFYNGKAGQHVYLTDFKHIYDYQLTSRTTISAKDVAVLNQTINPTITLITCNATGSMRVSFKGDLKKTYSYQHAPQHIKKLFNHKYNQK